MKNVILLSLFCAFITTETVSAQVSVSPVLNKITSKIKAIEDEGWQILFVQVDNIGEGATKTQTYYLKQGTKYGIMALGDDDRIEDIDLSIVDNLGYEVGKDDDDKNVAAVDIQPKTDATFNIKVTASTMAKKKADGFYGLLIVKYNTQQVSKSKLDE